MIMGFMAVELYMAIRHKSGWKSFAGMFLGLLLPAVPFVVCFLIYGNMGDFIQEYFLNTFTTIENKGAAPLSLHQIRIMTALGVLLIILVSGIVRVSRKHKLGYWLIPCLLLFIAGLGRPYSGYYYIVTMSFSIFLIMAIIEFVMRKAPCLHQYYKALCVVIAAISIGFNSLWSYRISFYEEAREDYFKAAYVMSQIKDPKVMYASGIGMPAGCLPAGRYWIVQSGATAEMSEEAKSYVERGIPDFVCTIPPKNEEDMGKWKEGLKEIESCGYVFYCTAPRMRSKFQTKAPVKYYVYGRPGLRLPPEDFHVSQWDVWLKRNIFGI